MNDMKAKGRADRVKKLKGERVGTSKLKPEQVLEIRAMAAECQSQRLIAIKFGIARSTVNQIVNRKRWYHI